jgi:hypothetical protein
MRGSIELNRNFQEIYIEEMNDHYEPTRPTNIPRHAEVCLQALVADGLNQKISLGGTFGLLHYLDYRCLSSKSKQVD